MPEETNVRRKAGDVVWKIPGGGSATAGAFVQLQEEENGGEPETCFICPDEGCRQWKTTLRIEAETVEEARTKALAGETAEEIRNVSECEMRDRAE